MTNSISTKKIIIFVILSFFVLFSARYVWMNYFNEQENIVVSNSVVSFDVNKSEQVSQLEGNWYFYPHVFIQSDELETYDHMKVSIGVAEDWRDETFRSKMDSYGSGTYYLQVQMEAVELNYYALYFSKIHSAARFYLNNEMISTFGNWDDESNPQGDYGPHTIPFLAAGETLDFVIHVANHENPLNGGITGDILLGTAIQVEQTKNTVKTFQIVVSILYIAHALFIFLFLILGRGQYDKELIYFAILLFLHSFMILINDYVPLHFDISVSDYQKLLQFLFITVNFSLLVFVTHLFHITSKLYSWIKWYYILLIVSLVFLPIDQLVVYGVFVLFFYIISFYYVFLHTFMTVRKNHPDAIFVLLFLIAYTSNIGWGALMFLDIISMPFYPFDFIITVLALDILILRKYIRITEVMEKQAIELRQADKNKDEFLANAAHELRNPLHGMINIITSTLLKEPGKLNEKTINNLHLVNKIGQQMKVMVSDILDAQQISYDELHLFKKPIEIDRLVKSVWQMVSFSVQNKNISFAFHQDGALRPVWGDENRVTQILFNILHNAVKYSNDGAITVHAKLINHEKTMEIVITDDGIGMSKVQMDQLFERYKHPHNKHYEGGLGIGLHITKQLVQMHGGTITAHSAEGVGSTFTFTLPVATDIQLNEQSIDNATIAEMPFDVDELVSELSDEIPKHKYKPLILAVDDDVVNLKVLHDLLSNHYELTTTTSPEEALSIIHDKSWDLIISDVMMPTMSGYELTKKIRDKFQIHELPILLLTARNQIEDIHSGFLVGANDYVAKPMEAVELLARVRALTEVKQSTFDQLRMEAAWLQAQIKPHFLFNILNSIAALSEIDTQRMIQLLDKFGTYLQRSFHVRNTYPLIPLTEELTLVEAYTYIESERFGERLTIEWKIPENVNFSVPPLSVQTLVENAIRHGVLQQPDGGTVKITVEEKTTMYTINIADDGVGMDEKTIDAILHPDSTDQYGIGIANTNRRLAKLFGTTLVITSKVGSGTSITMYIPQK